MARTFNGTTDTIKVSAAPVTAVPCTLAGWFKETRTNSADDIILVNVGTTAANSFMLQINANTSKVNASTNNGAGASSSTTYTTGTWFHGCGVYASATSRSVYLNGGGKVTDTTNLTPAGLNQTIIGGALTDGNNCFSGALCECAIWNIALSDTEVALIGSTTTPISPLLMHPESLVFYAPLLARASPEMELMRANNLTVTGTSISAHPRIFYPSRNPRGVGKAPIAAANTLFAQAIM